MGQVKVETFEAYMDRRVMGLANKLGVFVGWSPNRHYHWMEHYDGQPEVFLWFGPLWGNRYLGLQDCGRVV